MSNYRLEYLYNLVSKHSQYQILATPIRRLISEQSVKTHSRFEQERLNFILDRISPNEMTIADIGGNTGFFTFEFLYRGAKSALFIEGNNDHCAFVQEAVDALGWQDRVKVHPHYINFDSYLSIISVETCLLLNVLHHVGDDYGDQIRSIDLAKESIAKSLNRMALCTKNLVFQLGFNWKGNIHFPLFENGTKSEVIQFVESESKTNWIIKDVGIAEKSDTGIVYEDLNSTNIQRQDSLGEFLNRPLFILQSKLFDS